MSVGNRKIQGGTKDQVKLFIKIYYFIFKRFYLFIFRERRREREKERERNITVWLPLTYHPLGTWPATRHVSWPGIEPVSHWFTGWHSIHWATLARAIKIYFNKCILFIKVVSIKVFTPKQYFCLITWPHLASPSTWERWLLKSLGSGW